MMLYYHPAFDQYHCALRMMRVLEATTGETLEIEAIRILDFYMTFPALISNVRLSAALRKFKKKFLYLENPYYFTGTPKLVFQQMEMFQLMALRALVARDILDKDTFAIGQVRRGIGEWPHKLTLLIKKANDRDLDLMTFLREGLLSFSLYGENGLKARTGLLESGQTHLNC